MQLDNRISEDIIKIFHNSKGSIQNNIDKWTSDAIANSTNQYVYEQTNWDKYSREASKPHAAGQYEPRLQQNTDLNHDEPSPDSCEDTTKLGI